MYGTFFAGLTIETCDAQLRCVLPHTGIHLVDAWLEFLGRNRLIETEVIGDDVACACHIGGPLPFEVRTVRHATIVVGPATALPSVDGAVCSLVDSRLHVPVVGDAFRVLLEVVVCQDAVAELVLRERLFGNLFHMEVVHHEVAGTILVARLVCTAGADTQKQVVAVLECDIHHHALHVLCRRRVESSGMAGKAGAIVCVGQVVVARCAVAVVRFVRPVLHVAVVSSLVVGKEAGSAVEVLLYPHAAADFIDACAKFLGRHSLIESHGRGDGAVCCRLADVGLQTVLVASCLVHAALQGCASRRLLPTGRGQGVFREVFFERRIGQDTTCDIYRNRVHHFGQCIDSFDGKAVFELCDATRRVNPLHTAVMFVQSLYGSQRSGLAQYHINRFHANTAVSNMRSRQADRYNHIASVRLFRRYGTVGDIVRTFRQVTLHVAFVLHHAIHDVASAVV